MTTLDYSLAAPQPILMRFDDEAGDPITDMTFQIRLAVNGACVAVDGVLDGDMFEFDLSGIALAPRLHAVTIYSNDGGGWTLNQQLYLNAIMGC